MKVKTHIRRMLTENLKNPGDHYQFDTKIAEDTTPRKFYISATQVRRELPFDTESRKFGRFIIVRRTDWKGELMPGVPRDLTPVDILKAMVPWQDDPLYEEKTEMIHRCIDLFDN
jgi:hypothetical protein